MRIESIVKRLVTGRRANPRPSENRPTQVSTAQHGSALDLAFADYTRIDVGVGRQSITANPHEATKSLVAEIAAQVEALDQHRQKLAELLRNVSL
jgi:hypothetical protein